MKLLSEGLRRKNFRFDRGVWEDSGAYLIGKLGMKMKEFYLKQLFNNFKIASKLNLRFFIAQSYTDLLFKGTHFSLRLLAKAYNLRAF